MKELTKSIQNNLEAVLIKIDKAARISQRSGQQVQLIVVSKSQPTEIIEAAIEAGIEKLGENYPDEALVKIQKYSLQYPKIEWHMIGHLQSRKVDIIARHFFMFQALDSLHLAVKLNHKLVELDKKLPVLLEFNVSGEETKFGWPAWEQDKWDLLQIDMEKLLNLNNIKITGLMTMPPYFADSDLARPFFKKLKKLQEFLKAKFPGETFNELSMGTSADYEAAIHEGATIVRIGQAVLGPRHLKN
jgi:PLP dependent protein